MKQVRNNEIIRYCTRCGRALEKYVEPISKFDEHTGKQFYKAYLICPERMSKPWKIVHDRLLCKNFTDENGLAYAGKYVEELVWPGDSL